MEGFSTNIVNLIADNLRDRYQDDFQIIKELLQNADDAKNPSAKIFRFGSHSGFKDSKHPLLSGPALYFFNTGGFSSKDQRAIRSFAENSKAAEKDVIGKFGLGMKSIFHWCEAFFYFAQDGINEYHEGLNPWKQTDANIHPDWDEISNDDWEMIRKLFAQLSGEALQSGFLLWVPLRSKHHLKTPGPDSQETGCIKERFQDTQHPPYLFQLQSSELIEKIAYLLPLLQNLETISFRPSISDPSITGAFDIKLKVDKRVNHSVSRSNSHGSVISNPSSRSFSFYANQEKSTDAIFDYLKNQPIWPKSIFRNELGYTQEVTYHADPEGCVLFGHCPGNGRLVIKWTVFFPLEEKSHIFESKIEGGTKDYYVALHGQFFMDAGRRGIHGYRGLHNTPMDQSAVTGESELRLNWNAALSSKVTLNLFLPTIKHFVQVNKLSDEACHELTLLLLEAKTQEEDQKFIDRFRESICMKSSWIRQISQNEKNKWKLVPNNMEIRPLNNPPESNPALPWQVFNGLRDFTNSYVFFDSSAPAIMNHQPEWNIEEILNLIAINKNNIKDIFSNRSMLDYFYDFLFMHCTKFRASIPFQEQLRCTLSSGFLVSEESDLSGNRSKIAGLVALLPNTKRLKISNLNSLDINLLKELWRIDESVSLVPSDFYPDEQLSQTQPEITTVVRWLQTIDGWIRKTDSLIRKRYLNSTLKLSQMLFKSLSTKDQKLLPHQHSGISVITAHNAETGKKELISFKKLATQKDKGLLFGYAMGGESERLGLTPLLAKVLKDETIFLLNASDYRLYFGEEDSLPRADDRTVCLKTIGMKPRTLGSKAARVKMLVKADDPGDDIVAKRGLRYLLTGSFGNFFDCDTPLWISGHRQSEAWEKLWRLITRIGDQGAWNVLDRDLADILPRNKWDEIGIQEISPPNVIQALKSFGGIDIEPALFTYEEREEILATVDDRELWCKLALHTTTDGHTVAVGKNTYLDDGLEVDSSILEKIILIKRSEHPRVSTLQRKWLTPLDGPAVIDIALASDTPSEYWRTIMDLIPRISKLDKSIFESLSKVSWLPRNFGTPTSPEDVIDLPAIQDDVERLVAENGRLFSCVTNLDSDVRCHPGFGWLRENCFAFGEKGFEQLSLLLEETPGYHVGDIGAMDQNEFHTFSLCLSEITELPGWGLLNKIAESMNAWDKCCDTLYPSIKCPLPSHKLLSVLKQLTQSSEDLTVVRKVFNRYLTAFVSDKDFGIEHLDQLKLLNRFLQWKPANELCAGVKGIDAAFVLDKEQTRILNGIAFNTVEWKQRDVVQSDFGNFEFHSQAARDIVDHYFKSWQGTVSSGLIGAVIGLLGGDEKMHQLAVSYLRPHSFDWFVEMLQWRDPGRTQTGALRWLAGLSPDDALSRFRFMVSVADPEGLMVSSLTGENIHVRLSKVFDTLIVGEIGGRGYEAVLKLRRMDPSHFSSQERSLILKKTAEYLLQYLYNQKGANLEALWTKLDRSDQLETSVACDLILEHIPFYLRQLKVGRSNEKLALAIQDYEKCHARYVEGELENSTASTDVAGLRSKARNAKKHLAHLMQNDGEIQRVVLEAVREKLRDYQYGVDSIPFELFQNADDAVVEQGLIEGYPLEEIEIPKEARRFVVECLENAMCYMHWGRPINSRGPDGFDGEMRGYHHDLENMLIISSSDKIEDGRVTGKFGMGFKSVLLHCDRPRIISGQLQIEIISGILPKPWLTKGASKHRDRLVGKTKNVQRAGTLFKLDGETDIKQLENFRSLAGVLCVFARAIKTIEIYYAGNSVSFVWDPRPVTESMFVGKLQLESDEWGQDTLAMQIGRPGDPNGFLICLGPNGFRPFPRYVPTIWVTAPTREILDVGFVVNGAFDLDVGRAQLARGGGRNKGTAQKIGVAVGKALCELFENSTENWSKFIQTLGCASDLSPYSFWASLWDLLSGHNMKRTALTGEGPRDLVTTLLWGDSRFGLSRLISEKDALPTGLLKSYQCLTRVQSVCFSCRGILDEPEVFEHIADWEKFNKFFPPGAIVSHHRVGVILEKVSQTSQLKPLKLIDVIRNELNSETNVKPASAAHLGKLITEEWLTHWRDKGSSLLHEIDELVVYLDTLDFKGRDDQFHPSSELLIADADTIKSRDELARSGFAPSGRVLSNQYNTGGILFFLACRKTYEAGAKDLAGWMLNAEDDIKRLNALRYLIDGERGRYVATELRTRVVGTWMETIEDSDLLQNFSHNQRMVLLGQLDLHKEPEIPDFSGSTPPNNPKAVLTRVHEWWMGKRTEMINKYNTQIYPNGYFDPPDELGVRKNLENRKKWLTLFLLGALQSIGRTELEQHRNFIIKCEDNGWLDDFCHPVLRPEEWMRVLENYLEDESEDIRFYQWMKQFVSIFQLARWLPEYATVFMAINDMNRPFDFSSILKPRTMSDLDRGGPDAPPITRTLGIGAHFVVRELVRCGVLKNPHVFRHCFMPTRMIRIFFEGLGCTGIDLHTQYKWGTSGVIYDFICKNLDEEKATFKNCFDIPFRLICSDIKIQTEVLCYELVDENEVLDEEE